MTGLELAALVLHGLVPVLLIVHVGVAPSRRRALWRMDVAIAGLYLATVGVAGLWLALPRWIVGVEAALLLAAVGLGRGRFGRPGHEEEAIEVGDMETGEGDRRQGPRESGSGLRRVGYWSRIVLILLLTWVLGRAFLGRNPPEGEPLDLSFPLRNGTYLIANGGSDVLLNAHLQTLDRARSRSFRGQSYALDIVEVGGWGSRVSELSPGLLEGFAIYGRSVHAPCSGSVIRAEDGHPDRRPPGSDPGPMPGNHVILFCQGAWVLLAHLQEGTVEVESGERVREGRVLGRVGNSGSSNEPHLHLHAQTPGTAAAPLGGAPVPVSVDGRSPVRNDRVRVGPRRQPSSPRSR